MDLLAGSDLRFGTFHLDRRAGVLLRHDPANGAAPVAIGSRAFDLLCLLAARPGEVVSRQQIMDVVWPNTVVEEKNLTVQVSALRQLLDREGGSGSWIQTVTGRGYRFVPTVPEPIAENLPAPLPIAPPRERRWRIWLVGAAAAILLGVGAIAANHFWHRDRAPRLSVAVLPFQNLGGDPRDDYLADAITDDITTDLSHIQGAFVTARASAYSYRGRTVSEKQVGQELGVRYVLEGSVRRLDGVMRVNAQLVAAETGAQVWSDRFDETLGNAGTWQNDVVRRIGSALGVEMVQAASAARSSRPDALDLVLQARSLRNQPALPQRTAEARALFEQALVADPSSVPARLGLADILIEGSRGNFEWVTRDTLDRATKLIGEAEAAAPRDEAVLVSRAALMRAAERCEEATAAAQVLIDRFPNNDAGYRILASCKMFSGALEDAIPLMETAIRLNPLDPRVFELQGDIGFALLVLGRHNEAISWFERALAGTPQAGTVFRSFRLRQIAAAYALLGRHAEAQRELAAADRLWPYSTVRSLHPENPDNPAVVTQIRYLQNGFRLAGLRDHADEAADFGVNADGSLPTNLAGASPMRLPGIITIETQELVELLRRDRPIVLETVSNSWGQSIPGAIGLRSSGVGGSLGDTVQEHLKAKMAALTKGDNALPIVTVGWNVERFDGSNLALRLAALGYQHVYWYRPGREAWEVARLPETRLNIQDW